MALVPRAALHLHLDWEQTPMLSSSSSWWWHGMYAAEPGTQLQVRPVRKVWWGAAWPYHLVLALRSRAEQQACVPSYSADCTEGGLLCMPESRAYSPRAM